MSRLGSMQRLPTESARPMVVFAQTRLGIAGTALLAAVILGFPYGGSLAAVLAGVAMPWSLLGLFLARERPQAALSPLVALGDLAMLAIVEGAVPETYGAVRFLALALLAVHAHFQRERIGVGVALFGVAALVGPTVLLAGREEVIEGERLLFYEATFAACAMMTVVLIGRFRKEESASRLRARELSRRTLTGENEIRRRLSQALHDGPVQELIGLDMTLAAASAAIGREDGARAGELIREAGEITQRNVSSLRHEMLDLGPYAYDETSFEAAVERCLGVWERRFDISAELDIDAVELPSQEEGELFRITQEAVSNAGRHGHANHVKISLTAREDTVELTVADDGEGFGSVDPLGSTEAGHLGLASIRERAQLMRGTLQIDSSVAGTTVRVAIPHPRRSRFGLRQRASR